MSIYKAITEIAGELSKTGVEKSQHNAHGRYNFRGIDDVYNALAPLLARHGVCIFPRVINRECSDRPKKDGGMMFFVTVEVEFDFVCALDGSKHIVKTFGEAMDTSDKATNKAMSAAYKYAMFQVFCIPTEGQDADAYTPPVDSSPSHSANEFKPASKSKPAVSAAPPVENSATENSNVQRITAGQLTMLERALTNSGGNSAVIMKHFMVRNLADIPLTGINEALRMAKG